MQVAIGRNGERVKAWESDYVKEKGDYICPLCSAPVTVKKGDIKAHHFAHYPYTKCTYVSWEPESELHLRMKEFVYKLFKDLSWVSFIDLEYVLGDYIADVYLETTGGIKLAIECQASLCSRKRIMEKTKGHYKHGVYTLWISGDNKVKLIPIGNKVCKFSDNKLYLYNLINKRSVEVGYTEDIEFSGMFAMLSEYSKLKYDSVLNFAISKYSNVRCKCGRLIVENNKPVCGMTVEYGNNLLCSCNCGRTILIKNYKASNCVCSYDYIKNIKYVKCSLCSALWFVSGVPTYYIKARMYGTDDEFGFICDCGRRVTVYIKEGCRT